MASVASKNLFALLGNDVENEDDVPKETPKEVIKKSTTSKKRDEGPVTSTVTNEDGRSHINRRGRGDGNEAAFRDRGNGRQNNRTRPTDETGTVRERYGDRPPRGRGGGRGRGRDFDRHSATNRTDTDKQVSQGWGSNKGPNEWNDEQAGESIAQAEATDEAVAVTGGEARPENAEGETPAETAPLEPEPEDKTMSYAQYLAERSQQGPVEELPEARVANEGNRENKKWATAKELVKEDDEEYIAGGKSKNRNARQRKEKAVLEIDQRFVDPRDVRRGSGDRGGRGGRGARSDRGDRPARGRSDFRSGRGGYRGGSNGGNINVQDESAFPTLGTGK